MMPQESIEKMEREPIRECILCIPDMQCKMIGELGRIKARITLIPSLHQKIIAWNRIEECSIRNWIIGGSSGSIKDI